MFPLQESHLRSFPVCPLHCCNRPNILCLEAYNQIIPVLQTYTAWIRQGAAEKYWGCCVVMMTSLLLYYSIKYWGGGILSLYLY